LILMIQIAQNKKRLARDAREPSKFPHTMPGLGQASLRASNFSAANWRKGVRRSVKGPLFDATECDAQHKNAAAQTAKPPAHTETGGFAFPHTMLWGGNVWGSRTGVQAKRPDPTKKSYALRGRPQAAFSWRWNSNSKAVGASQRLTALPSSPIRAVFLDGIRWSAEPGSEVMRQLHLPPTFRSKKRGTLSPTREE
jgi:hypothetical protein